MGDTPQPAREETSLEAKARLLDELPCTVYVTAVDNDDLLFFNRTGRRLHGAQSIQGMKCYNALHYSSACPMEQCPKALLKEGQVREWQAVNAQLRKRLTHRGVLTRWQGRPAMLVLAFEAADGKGRESDLEVTLAANLLVTGCLRLLHDPSLGFDASVIDILERVGTFLVADRCYVFHFREERTAEAAREWHAPTAPVQTMLQKADISRLSRALGLLRGGQCVVVPDVEEVRREAPAEYELMAGRGIRTYVIAPLAAEGELIGCIGVSNPKVDLKYVSPLLLSLSYFLSEGFRQYLSTQELQRMSYLDGLTGLGNYNAFDKHMHELCAMAPPVSVGVVYVDVNGLKNTNDEHGHEAGDQLLVRVARIVRENFGADSVYRIGGDEFVAVAKDIAAGVFYQKVETLVRHLLPYDGSLALASIGGRWGADCRELEHLLQEADREMYENKRRLYAEHGLAVPRHELGTGR